MAISNNIFLTFITKVKNTHFTLNKKLAVLFSIILIMFCSIFSYIAYEEINTSAHQQAEAFGETISKQTANMAGELLMTNDRISLNVLLSDLVENPYIYSASIYSTKNQLLASATTKSKKQQLATKKTYTAPVHHQEVFVGLVRIKLNDFYISKPAKDATTMVVFTSIMLLICGLLLFIQQTNRLSLDLRKLTAIIQRKDKSAIYQLKNTTRNDELGLLARSIPSLLPPDTAPVVEVPSHILNHSATICIQFSNIDTLKQCLTSELFNQMLNQQLNYIETLANQHSGHINYSTEGNVFISFLQNQVEDFFFKAIQTAIDILNYQPSDQQTNKITMGLGISIDNQPRKHPTLSKHPALQASAACEAKQIACLATDELFIHEATLEIFNDSRVQTESVLELPNIKRVTAIEFDDNDEQQSQVG
ncbi:AhpA/YtjB family protein [Spartinivicinus marinus]|uniref:AhpA/YtjB family protein n=1 Tax=Spartinivicinus marinus TaxID=2994442 RepID=UPI00224ED141|nr:AhpA/YtjB family protein [Spartinivicinus marinus]